MLEKQSWMHLAKALPLEWRQSKDEGRQVDAFKEVCDNLAAWSDGYKDEKQAVDLAAIIARAPIAPDFAFVEPSTIEDIQGARPSARPAFSNTLSDAVLQDKIGGAWIGRIAGCLLGKPVEGLKRVALERILKDTSNFPMKDYILEDTFTPELKTEYAGRMWADRIPGAAPIDDDTNYTVLGMKIVKEYGKAFRPNDVLEAWLRYLPFLATCTAERVAYANAAAGMLAPATATHKNPYREWIGAQIRGDFFGYIHPGNPEAAAEMAFRDACISHIKNGIYGEMMAAAMIAAAAVCDDMHTVIQAGLGEIPENCRLRRDIDLVLAWHKQGLDAEAAIDMIHKTYDEYNPHDWCHTNSNAMVVVMALLYGEYDFGKSICLAVQAAFDTDCNGATVGSIIGIMLGQKAIPTVWPERFQYKVLTSIAGYPVATVEELVTETLPLVEKPAVKEA